MGHAEIRPRTSRLPVQQLAQNLVAKGWFIQASVMP